MIRIAFALLTLRRTFEGRERRLMSGPRGSRNKGPPPQVECPVGEARNAGEDFVGVLRSEKRFRVRMMRGDELANGRLHLGDAAVDTTTQLTVCQLGKPPLQQVEPGAVGWGEVDLKRGRFSNELRISGVLSVP